MFWDLVALVVIVSGALLISPLVVLAYALRHVWGCGRVYVSAFAQVLGVPEASRAAPVPPPPLNQSADGREPAYEHYLFGQVRRDLAMALSRALTRERRDFTAAARQIWDRRLAGPWTMSLLWRRLVGVLLLGGLMAGTLAAGLFLTAAALLQVLIVIVFALLGISVIFSLRAVDSTLLRVRGIRMTCPKCYRHIPYPSYRCPGCGALHRDVRPGRYGVMRRRCGCGECSLPTLLILGSHRLAAFCPHRACGVPLADTAGTATEVMLALFGGSNVGKTRLLTIMVMALREQKARGAATVEVADRVTGRRLDELTPALLSNLPTSRTDLNQPRAYSLYVSLAGSHRQLAHFFDTGGEQFYDSEKLAALEYFRSARTLIFVIDPFSIDGVWDGLAPARRDEFPPRADHSPSYVFQQLVRNVKQMNADLKQIRLGVTVSKADVLAREHLPAPGLDSALIEEWLVHMDQENENLVRSMRHTFGEVRFFHTSAMLADGAVPRPIHDVVAWALAGSEPPPAAPEAEAGQ
jgi:hypothetical protein